MKLSRLSVADVRPAIAWLLMALLAPVAAFGADTGSWTPTRSTNDANTRKGFESFYSLEYDKSIRDCRNFRSPCACWRHSWSAWESNYPCRRRMPRRERVKPSGAMQLLV